ncbi:hypothetical protein Tco_0927120 [Tanacetum coccineum]|uniref:Uncharacterized protein n=1 Tax=Tanacetum coccineum TaxID=301880 RepID=A0ABQ5DBS6_9ASTR
MPWGFVGLPTWHGFKWRRGDKFVHGVEGLQGKRSEGEPVSCVVFKIGGKSGLRETECRFERLAQMVLEGVFGVCTIRPCGYITFGDLAKQVPKSYITLFKIRPFGVQHVSPHGFMKTLKRFKSEAMNSPDSHGARWKGLCGVFLAVGEIEQHGRYVENFLAKKWIKCILPTEGMRSVISTVSISLGGFLPSILLLVMIIVAVVIVAVILVVVVVAIVGVVIVVMIIGFLAQNCALLSDPLASGLC